MQIWLKGVDEPEQVFGKIEFHPAFHTLTGDHIRPPHVHYTQIMIHKGELTIIYRDIDIDEIQEVW